MLMFSINGAVIPAKTIVRGRACNADGTGAGGVIVRLFEEKRLKGYATSASDGTFEIKTDTILAPARLVFISLKHAPAEYHLEDISAPVEVLLQPKAFELQEVVVKAPERRVKGDTIVYDVAAMTKAGDRTIEDIIKKIPGIQIDESGGIKYDGESINHFYIEGLDLMGKNYMVATRNISPSDISSVSVYQRHQSKKVLQGREDSKKAALNLKLKKNRMLKPLGYVSAGAGCGSEALWSGTLYGMLIAPGSQTIVSAGGNNTGNVPATVHTGGSAGNPFGDTPFGSPSIKTERYVENRSMNATVNNLLRLSHDLTMTVNADYGNDCRGFDGFTSTEYLSPDLLNTVYSETADNSLRRNIVNASAKIENNSRTLFLSDVASFSGNFGRNSYLVTSDAEMRQRQESDRYRFSNIFNTIIRRGRRFYEIESETNYDNYPLMMMQAMNAVTAQNVVRQDVTCRVFHNREHTSFSWDIGLSSAIGLDLSFEAECNEFSSGGTAITYGESVNNLSGHNIVSAISPFFNLRKGRLRWKTRLPVSLYNMRYNDKTDGTRYSFDRVFVDFSSSLSFKYCPASFWELSISHTNKVGDMTDFIDNPIYTTFRNSRTMGTGRLERGHDNTVRGAYIFKNFINEFYLTARMLYKKTESNSLPVNNAGETGTSSSWVKMNSKGSTSSLSFDATKRVRDWHTTFNLSANIMMTDRERIRSDVKLDVRSTTYIFSGKIDTYQFDDLVSAAITGSYSLQHQSFGGVMPVNSQNELMLTGKATVHPVKNLDIYVSANYSRVKLGESNYKSNTFLDAGARYSFRKIELELAARNLTDMRRYYYTIYRSLDLTYNSYSLRPLEVMLTAKYKF